MAVAGGSGSRPFVGNRRPQEPGRSRQRQPAVPAGGSRCPPPRDPPASGARAAAAGWPGGVREGRRGGGKKRGHWPIAVDSRASATNPPAAAANAAAASRCHKSRVLEGRKMRLGEQGKARSHRAQKRTQDADKKSARCPGPTSATRWQLQGAPGSTHQRSRHRRAGKKARAESARAKDGGPRDGGAGDDRRWRARATVGAQATVGAGGEDGGIVAGFRRGQSGEAPATTGSHEHIAPRGRSPATGLRQGPSCGVPRVQVLTICPARGRTRKEVGDAPARDSSQ